MERKWPIFVALASNTNTAPRYRQLRHAFVQRTQVARQTIRQHRDKRRSGKVKSPNCPGRFARFAFQRRAGVDIGGDKFRDRDRRQWPTSVLGVFIVSMGIAKTRSSWSRAFFRGSNGLSRQITGRSSRFQGPRFRRIGLRNHNHQGKSSEYRAGGNRDQGHGLGGGTESPRPFQRYVARGDAHAGLWPPIRFVGLDQLRPSFGTVGCVTGHPHSLFDPFIDGANNAPRPSLVLREKNTQHTSVLRSRSRCNGITAPHSDRSSVLCIPVQTREDAVPCAKAGSDLRPAVLRKQRRLLRHSPAFHSVWQTGRTSLSGP